MNLIDHLPRDSFFVEALLNDDEYADQLLNMPDAPGGERLSEWSPEREALARVEDAVRALLGATITAHGGKAKITPTPRPSTAIDRAKRRRRRAEHQALVRRVLRDRG